MIRSTWSIITGATLIAALVAFFALKDLVKKLAGDRLWGLPWGYSFRLWGCAVIVACKGAGLRRDVGDRSWCAWLDLWPLKCWIWIRRPGPGGRLLTGVPGYRPTLRQLR